MTLYHSPFTTYNNFLLGLLGKALAAVKSLQFGSPTLRVCSSARKEFFVILCWEDDRGGKAAWVVDSKNRTVVGILSSPESLFSNCWCRKLAQPGEFCKPDQRDENHLNSTLKEVDFLRSWTGRGFYS